MSSAVDLTGIYILLYHLYIWLYINNLQPTYIKEL